MKPALQVIRKSRRPLRSKVEALSQGRIVRYVDTDGTWPAVIVQVLQAELRVLLLWVVTPKGWRLEPRVHYAAKGTEVGTWHWPPR